MHFIWKDSTLLQLLIRWLVWEHFIVLSPTCCFVFDLTNRFTFILPGKINWEQLLIYNDDLARGPSRQKQKKRKEKQMKRNSSDESKTRNQWWRDNEVKNSINNYKHIWRESRWVALVTPPVTFMLPDLVKSKSGAF